MSKNVRTFDFVGVTLTLDQALDVIEAALDDEGLRLVGRDNQGSQVAYAIRRNKSSMTVIVPLRYIAERSI